MRCPCFLSSNSEMRSQEPLHQKIYKYIRPLRILCEERFNQIKTFSRRLNLNSDSNPLYPLEIFSSGNANRDFTCDAVCWSTQQCLSIRSKCSNHIILSFVRRRQTSEESRIKAQYTDVSGENYNTRTYFPLHTDSKQ